jgi:uncharacterized protein YggE
MIRALLAATGVVALAVLANPSLAQEIKPMPRAISITGHGELKAAPDMASISIGVVSHAATAKEAVAANTQAMTKVLGSLKAAGIAEKDIQTSNFSLQPRYDYSQAGEAPRVAGYDASNTVTIQVRKLDSLGLVLDTVVQQGSNQVSGIQFGLAEPEAKLDEARKRAAADAQRKARLYAETMGFTLGNVISLSETSNVQPPLPIYAKTMRAEAADMAAVPIAQGEQTIGADVNITWEIK